MNALASVDLTTVARAETIPLGMAQLAFHGLSEDWWLRHLGDVHWQLIADALGQRTTVFWDKKGRQMYAAFCATEFEQLNPDLATLGQNVEVKSQLWSAGKSKIQSNHFLYIDGAEIARFTLLSTFVVHKEIGVNASVSRVTPYLISVLQYAPDGFAQETATLAKELRDMERTCEDAITMFPCVGSDFNAVGLLYFPSFTRLFEHVEARSAPTKTWSAMRRRRVLYLSNIERGEHVSGAMSGHDRQSMTLWRSATGSHGAKKLAHCYVERYSAGQISE
ncbi:Pnap_2097 family protein [Maritalea sp.]|uniref:Pnap_2097 family protein n=1 Tax=Maritalea sp. TaxID=2003361 RepID=UPI003EF7A6EA